MTSWFGCKCLRRKRSDEGQNNPGQITDDTDEQNFDGAPDAKPLLDIDDGEPKPLPGQDDGEDSPMDVNAAWLRLRLYQPRHRGACNAALSYVARILLIHMPRAVL